MFRKVLIANRGEIACRIIRTCRKLGIESVSVYSDADVHSRHVKLSDEAINIGPAEASKSYLDIQKILDAVKKTKSEAVHPGYGFLSENSNFANALENNGVRFVGPPIEAIRLMGSKSESKKTMIKAGISVIPGYNEADQDIAMLKAHAQKIGLPLLIKATYGGGGKGMRLVRKLEDFEDLCNSAKNEGMRSFGNDSVILEKFIARPRHVEVQIFGDTYGNYVYLFERDCSSQRRHQKIVEEAPAPTINSEFRKRLGEAAVQAARIVKYVGAGTVEFLVDQDSGEFFFLEMNTRLQVEHPITEMITGVDLVEWQLRVAAGDKLPLSQKDLRISGCSLEARIYAENPLKNFAPDTGVLSVLQYPPENENFRFETGVEQGDTISVHYDPMIAKVVTHGPNRDVAIERLNSALSNMKVAGVATNIEFVKALLRDQSFLTGTIDSNHIDINYQKLLPTPLPREIILSLAATHLSSRELGNAWSRVGLTRKSKFDLSIDGVSASVAITRYESNVYVVEIGSEKIQVRLLDSNSFVLDGSIHRPNFANTPNGLAIYLKGVKTEVEFVQAESSGTATGHVGELKVKSTMSSKITAVHVKAGDEVKKGDKLVVSEAMKMEHVMKSPIDGVVERVSVRPGQMVAANEVLVTLKSKN